MMFLREDEVVKEVREEDEEVPFNVPVIEPVMEVPDNPPPFPLQ